MKARRWQAILPRLTDSGKAQGNIAPNDFVSRKSLRLLLIIAMIGLIIWLALCGPLGGLSELRKLGEIFPNEYWQVLTSFGDHRAALIFALIGWLAAFGIRAISLIYGFSLISDQNQKQARQ